MLSDIQVTLNFTFYEHDVKGLWYYHTTFCMLNCNSSSVLQCSSVEISVLNCHLIAIVHFQQKMP